VERDGGNIAVKRAYERATREDGTRFLVERLWPRGVSKETLAIESWLRDVAPSTELRKWFGHDPARWNEFRRRYFIELQAHPQAWQPLLEAAAQGHVTLVYSAHDTEHNAAVALREFLGHQMGHQGHGAAGGAR
jgi:uncharacterized protein YeaO (DUF488 family)